MSRPVKVTPQMVQRMRELREVGLSNRQVAQQVGVSIQVVQRAVNDRYRNAFLSHLKTPCAPSQQENHTNPAPQAKNGSEAVLREVDPEVLPHPEAAPATPKPTETPEEVEMLLQKQALSPEARKHFGLPRNPFLDDVQSPDDVFQSPSVRYVRAALMDCAQHHGFVAVVGESGAGKSTLAEDLEERIKAEGRDVLVIRPYVLAMEANDQKGKTLKSGHIAESIAHALDPRLKVRSSPEARFRQVHELLKASRKAGRRHLLVVEEAHCLPTATLKHLKRFLELKDGMQRLIGVALIGQPELRERLNSQNPEVREVMQRCECIELEPLDNDLEGYLRHKFTRFELRFEEVFSADASDAIRARLVHMPRGGRAQDARSVCFPLVVNNLVCRAMNAAARAGWPKVDGQVIGGC